MKPTRFWTLGCAVLMRLLIPGCVTSEPEESMDPPQGVLRIDDVMYELRAHPNVQGPEAPCVGVSGHFDDGTLSTMACPTEEAEEDEYAAALAVRDRTFVAGYGLRDGETLDMPEAVGTLTTEPVEGRRFFLALLSHLPEDDQFDIRIEGPDGPRNIQGYVSEDHSG